MSSTESSSTNDGATETAAHQLLDSKDQRTHANTVAAATAKSSNEPDLPKTEEGVASQIDPTLPAQMHGNEPSRGAKIDEEIMRAEEEELKNKGKI